MGTKVVEITTIFDVLKLRFCLCLSIAGERILEHYGRRDAYQLHPHLHLIESYYAKSKSMFKNRSSVFTNHITNTDTFETTFSHVRNGVFLVKLHKTKER